jgi:hypothetical protein
MDDPSSMMNADFSSGLDALVSILVVVVLYNLLFIVVDLRKITRRIEGISKELETVIMKPLSLTDKALQWAVEIMEGKKKNIKHKKSKE